MRLPEREYAGSVTHLIWCQEVTDLSARRYRSLLVEGSFAVVTFLEVTAHAAISVQIAAPANDSVQAGPALDISASVDSTFQLQSVVAQVENVSTNLVYGSGWTGSIELTNLSTGQKTLTVTA